MPGAIGRPNVMPYMHMSHLSIARNARGTYQQCTQVSSSLLSSSNNLSLPQASGNGLRFSSAMFIDNLIEMAFTGEYNFTRHFFGMQSDVADHAQSGGLIPDYVYAGVTLLVCFLDHCSAQQYLQNLKCAGISCFGGRGCSTWSHQPPRASDGSPSVYGNFSRCGHDAHS
jgi:hypothetical protein